MIKVLHYIPGFLYGGIESMFLSWYKNIDQNDIKFELLIRTQEDDAPALRDYRNLGGIYYRLPKLSLKNMLQFKKSVEEFFRENHDYDILHVHGNSIFVMHYAKKYGIKKIIIHSHSADRNKGIKSLIKFIYDKYAIRRYADYAFACSNLAAEYKYGGNSFKNNPVSIIHNAIEIDKYKYNQNTRERIRKDFHWDNKFIIGHIGRLTYQKNQFFLIDIFNEFQKEEKNSLLVVIGDGPDESKLKEYAKSLGLKDKILFLGTKDNANEFLQGFDLFLLPSRWEGLPVALIEAQTAGLPCIISDVISEEADITQNITRMSLEEQAQEWAMVINNKKIFARNNTTEQIAFLGYDVSQEVDELNNKYNKIVKGDNN